ncbi:MAG: hypothetical protein JWP97_4561 [Labilithrix sp.]|nr:hypothetical protein [Labilithrix sp.]
MSRRLLACGVSSLLLSSIVIASGCSDDPGLTSQFDAGAGSSGTSGASGTSGDPGHGFADAGGTADAGGGQDPLTNSCATASAEARRVPVYMQFIIDGSGSMDGSNGAGFIPGERETDPLVPTRQTGKKWIAVRGALDAFFADLATKNDPSIAVGLYLFSSNTVKPANAVDVPIKYVDAAQAAALQARLAPPVFASGGTPLGASIDGQLTILQSFTPVAPVEAGGKYVLVAMTDGIPTDSKAGCIGSVTAARTGTPPVATFAVGVGNEDADPAVVYDEAFMKDLAMAGGTAVPGCNPSWGNADKTGTPCHFQITPGTKTAAQIQADFLAAINKIRDTVASCEFPLTKPADAGALDPANVNVIMTPGSGPDRTLPQDPANGWEYDDATNPTKVFLRGKACDDLKADAQAKIKIVIGCKTVTGPGTK